MNTVSQFLDMGGYAIFVWPAFGVAAIVLTALALVSVRNLRKERRLFESLPKRRMDTGD